jgi:hypothetical protein
MKSSYWKALAVLAAAVGLLLGVQRVAAAHSEDWDRDGRDVGGYRDPAGVSGRSGDGTSVQIFADV